MITHRSSIVNGWIPLILILFVTSLVYLPIFWNGFVIDDHVFIGKYHPSIAEAFGGAVPPGHEGVYRPLRGIIYTVYNNLFGTNPFFYHLHSLIVHLMATVLVYFIVLEIFTRINPKSEIRSTKQYQNSNDQNSKQFRIWNLLRFEFVSNFDLPAGEAGIRASNLPFIAALLFGLHPVHTESITYVAASMEMTGLVFMLAAFWLYLRNSKFAIILALFAFFTYEMTITLPLLLLLYEFTLGTFHPRGERSPHLGGVIRKTVPFLLGAAGFFAVRFALGVGLSRGEYLAYSFFHTQLTMTKMWVKYLSLLVWPVTLSHNHTVVTGFEAFMTPYSDQAAILSQTILDPEILLAIGVIGVIGVIGWKLRKKYPLVSFCLGWFFISLLPVGYFLPQGTAIAEKYLYIASFGFVLALAHGLGKLGKWGMVAVLTIALLYGVRTIARNANWQSPRTLWEYEARIHPTSELAFYNLGIIYAGAGEKEKAIAAYTKALELKGQFWQAKHNLQKL